MVEHHRRRLGLGPEQLLHPRLDLGRARGFEFGLLRLGPCLHRFEPAAHPADRLRGLVRPHLGGVAITPRVVGGVVIREPVGQRLDEGRAAARTPAVEPDAHRLVHRDHVVAVRLLDRDPGRQSLLRQRLARGLLRERGRDRPPVVGDREHHRQAPDPGEVERLVHVALRGGGVAEHAHHRTALATVLHRVRGARRVQGVAADGDGGGEVVRGAGPAAAALAARVVGEHFVDADPAPEQGRVLAVRRHENVGRAHRTRDPDRHRLLPIGGRIGAEPALPVQGDALRVQGAGQDHRAVERRDRLRRCQRLGQRAHQRAVLVEVAPPADLETGDDGEIRRGVSRHRPGLDGKRVAPGRG